MLRACCRVGLYVYKCNFADMYSVPSKIGFNTNLSRRDLRGWEGIQSPPPTN